MVISGTTDWEWRGFRRVDEDSRLGRVAESIARELDVTPPKEMKTADDTYILIPGVNHNLKVRRGALEIKIFLSQEPDGLSQWEEKKLLTFPLSRKHTTLLWDLLPGPSDDEPLSIASVGELFTVLRRREPRLMIVPVRKHRIRFHVGDARLEVAGQELPRGFRLLSYCVDGTDMDSVKDLVCASGIRPGTRVMSWIEFLKEAVWWVPSLIQEEEAW